MGSQHLGLFSWYSKSTKYSLIHPNHHLNTNNSKLAARNHNDRSEGQETFPIFISFNTCRDSSPHTQFTRLSTAFPFTIQYQSLSYSFHNTIPIVVLFLSQCHANHCPFPFTIPYQSLSSSYHNTILIIVIFLSQCHTNHCPFPFIIPYQ